MSSSDAFLNDALFEAAREIGSAETPTELSKRGVRRVRFVPRAKMAEFLERAVAKIVEERRANNGEVSLLVGDVQTGLLGLLRGAQDVETARRDIAEQRHSLQDDLAAIVRDRDPARDSGGKIRPSGPESQAEREARERERERTIDRLERRVAKLIATLKETELALQRALVNQKLDTGIESLYRVVQGLSMNDPQADQKREMMREIFQANLELTSMFERDRPGVER